MPVEDTEGSNLMLIFEFLVDDGILDHMIAINLEEVAQEDWESSYKDEHILRYDGIR